MYAKAGNNICDRIYRVNQFEKIQDISTDNYMHLITIGLLEKDEAYIKAAKCLAELESQEAYKLINDAYYFWDVYNLACLLYDEFKLFSIEKIHNKSVLLGAALMIFNFSKDDRKENFLHIVKRLYSIESSLADKLIIECERMGKFPEWLVYILNNSSLEQRIEIVLCLPFDFNIFIHNSEMSKFKQFEKECKRLFDSVYDDISYTVRDKWNKYIISLLEEKSSYGNICFSAYSNLILNCLIHCYKNNKDEYISDLENTFQEFENIENEWLRQNQSFCGPYFALITKYHFLHLINKELKMIGKKSTPELFDRITEFQRKQFKYIGYWKNTNMDYSKYFDFYDAC